MISSMLLHVTHIEDSVRSRKGPCVYFWGVTHDRSLSLLMESYIATIQKKLNSKSPPLNVSELDNRQICCVLINKKWLRTRISEPKLNSLGTLQVFCVDNGETLSVPLSFLRTVDITGVEADCIRQWPPLASKFILADIVGSQRPGFASQWSISAIFYLKNHLENRTWKAVLLGTFAGYQGVRLFNSANELFVATMVQAELGVPSQTFQEALYMSKILNELANIKLVPDPVLGISTVTSTPTGTATSSQCVFGNSQFPYDTPLSTAKVLPSPFTLNRDQLLLVNVLESKNTSSRNSTHNQTTLFNPTTVTVIPAVGLDAEESLFVIFSNLPGSFFGKLEKIPVKNLDEMATELFKVYSSLPNPPRLYVNNKSRLGHYGVLQWNEDQNNHHFRRVLVITEQPDDDVEVYFIDYGNSLSTSRYKILAPLDCLTRFRQPPHGIHCKLDGNFSLAFSKWNNFILDKWVRVKVGKCMEGIYTVTFTDDSVNNELAKIVLPTPASTARKTAPVSNMKKYSSPLASSTVLPKAIPPSILIDNKKIRNASPECAPQNINFAPEQVVSSCAVASHIKSLTEFWVQLEPKTVTSIMERLDSLGLHPDFINKKDFVASVGKLCLAFYREADDFFPDDGRWHRAVVKRVDGDTATVYCFDYGHTFDVRTILLRDIPSDYAKLPALAFKCCLHGAEALSEAAADDFINRFVKRTFFAVKFLKVIDGVLHIRLFTSGGVDLLEKHHKKFTPPSTPETVPVVPEANDFSKPFAFLVNIPHSSNN